MSNSKLIVSLVLVVGAGLFTSAAADTPDPGETAPEAPYIEACTLLPPFYPSDYEIIRQTYRDSDNSWYAATCLGRCGDDATSGPTAGSCACDFECCERDDCCEDFVLQCLVIQDGEPTETCGNAVLDAGEECDLGSVGPGPHNQDGPDPAYACDTACRRAPDDLDGDGVRDGHDLCIFSPDPFQLDSDGDGVGDACDFGGPNTTYDTDADGLSDMQEATLGTNPADPDTDHDMLQDGVEVHAWGTNPLVPDTDGGGVLDGIEVLNGTWPLFGADDHDTEDTDADGLTTGIERLITGTNPADYDTDDDSLSDGTEYYMTGTSPLDPDTDGDGIPDGIDTQTTHTYPGV